MYHLIRRQDETVRYSIGTNEMVQHFNSTFNGILLPYYHIPVLVPLLHSLHLLHYYHIRFVVNSYVSDPGKSLINDN